MIDLSTINPATLQAGPELDALIAEKWMGWRVGGELNQYWVPIAGSHLDFSRHLNNWHPSTNPAHSGEARRKADDWTLALVCCVVSGKGYQLGILCSLWSGEESVCYDGFCVFSETNGNKGEAEALATCRAIAAAMKEAEAMG